MPAAPQVGLEQGRAGIPLLRLVPVDLEAIRGGAGRCLLVLPQRLQPGARRLAGSLRPDAPLQILAVHHWPPLPALGGPLSRDTHLVASAGPSNPDTDRNSAAHRSPAGWAGQGRG